MLTLFCLSSVVAVVVYMCVTWIDRVWVIEDCLWFFLCHVSHPSRVTCNTHTHCTSLRCRGSVVHLKCAVMWVWDWQVEWLEVAVRWDTLQAVCMHSNWQHLQRYRFTWTVPLSAWTCVLHPRRVNFDTSIANYSRCILIGLSAKAVVPI